MALSKADLSAALGAIAGEANVIADEERMARHLNEPRRRFHASAAAVVTPPDTETLQEIVRWANRTGTAIVPQGGNTGLVGGQVPLEGNEIIVALGKLNRVRHVDAAAGHMTVEAGETLQQAQDAAERAGALFPLTIASQGSAQIGGVLSANAGGVQVLAYGNARELCLGVDAVMPDGSHYRGLNSLKKDNTGYDLRDLLVGAEGTLGIITAATLKLYPQPEAHETALVSLADPRPALDLFDLLRSRAGQSLTAFELLPRIGIDFQLRHGMLPKDPSAGPSPWYGLIEISRPVGGRPEALNDALEAALGADLITDASIAMSGEDRALMWRLREQMSECQRPEGISIKHDVSVPVAAIPDLIEKGQAAAAAIVPDIRPVSFGHMGDGNLHFNFSQPEGADPEAFRARQEDIHEAVYEVVTALGGSVSAEHGIGQLKTVLLERVKDPVALEIMHRIKKALDPNGIMNPGKLLGSG